MGIASLVLGIIGFFIGVTIFKDLALILCVLALVLGIIAIVKKKNKVIAIIAVVISVIGFIVVFKEDDSKKAIEKNATEIVDVTDENGDTIKTKGEKSEAEYEVGKGIVKVWTNSIGTKWISASIPVKNTGKTDLYLSSGTFDIENNDGTLEDTMSMVQVYPQVIKPGETAYYFEETTYNGSATSGLKVVPHVEIEKATVDCTRFEVSEVQIKDEEYSGVNILGRVENKTDTEGTSVYVAVHLFDSDKNLIGVESTILDNGLKAGEKKAFQISSYNTEVKASQIASYAVYAFPYQYQF